MIAQRYSSTDPESELFEETYGRESNLPPYLQPDEEDAVAPEVIALTMPHLTPGRPGSPYSEADRARAIRANELSYVVDDLVYDEDHEMAMEVAREVVRLYRPLAELDPSANRPLLAGALHSLSMRHLELDRLGPALRAAEDASALYRELARTRPLPFLPDLAGSLLNVSVRRSDLDRPVEALPPAEESVGIYRKLAGARPDRFGPDLAAALDNLVRRHGDLGHFTEALHTAEEAVALCRNLASIDAGLHQGDLAGALLSAAWICAHGRLDPARGRPAAQEAAELLTELAAGEPLYAGPRNVARTLLEQLSQASPG